MKTTRRNPPANCWPRSVDETAEHVRTSVIGVCVDTGWFGTHEVDAVAALRAVAPRLVYVHLKDVLAPGGHETCRYGRGCVPIQACVQTLVDLGYAGGISIEHEPELYDPNEDCRANLALVQGWLGAADV